MSPFGSALSFYWNRFLCRLLGTLRAKAPSKPDYAAVYTSDFEVVTYGECSKGTYLEVYRPHTPLRGADGKAKAVVYLHGFALGPSRIYRAQLEHLARQGIYVFYPNYMTGFCHFEGTLSKTVEELIDEIFGDEHLGAQYYWMQNALKSVQGAFEAESLADDALVETYLFGHSLGGLFAISWPYYVNRWAEDVAQGQDIPTYLLPQQIVAADPIPSSLTIPGKLGKLIAKLIPQVDVKVTGADVTMPLAILHGQQDWVVPPTEWDDYFPAIATPCKRMFLSRTDTHGCGGLFANHEQSTVDTSFFPNWAALLVLDGVGEENALNWNFIWPPLDRAVRDGERVDEFIFDMGAWSDGQPVRAVQVYLPDTGET